MRNPFFPFVALAEKELSLLKDIAEKSGVPVTDEEVKRFRELATERVTPGRDGPGAEELPGCQRPGESDGQGGEQDPHVTPPR